MGLKVQAEEAAASGDRAGEPGPAAIGPRQAERKRAAVELIRGHERALLSTSRRYSICSEDADDAYQRGIEILLSKAPTTDPRHLLPWTRTVIKHEALAVRKARERLLGRPIAFNPEQPDEDWIEMIPSPGEAVEDAAVARERVARSREALGTLKPQELKALTQLAEGFSYAEIARLNSWTYTKVNRCVAEGRQRFRSVFRDSEAGERCPDFEPMLSAACDGELPKAEKHELEDHLAVCGYCRATLRTYRAAPRAAAALAPVLPLTHSLWERLQEAVVSLQVRLGGIGGGSADPGVSAVAATGGSRGMGTAALAKLMAVCLGTAGGAAACVATGVVPAPPVSHPDRAQVPRQEIVKTVAERPSRQVPAVAPADTDQNESAQPEPAAPSAPEEKSEDSRTQSTVSAAPTPAPTPTESEFTAEAAGTPVAASAPSPPPKAPANKPPVSNGGGEFAP